MRRSGAGCFLGFLKALRLDRLTAHSNRKAWAGRGACNLDDLEELCCIGSGAFGTVALVRHTATGEVMALKALSKGMLVNKSLQRAVLLEKETMQAACSLFVVRLLSTFNSSQHLYFLMEAAMGGDLYAAYNRHDLYGSETHARFYAACVIRGFEHLHGRGVLYRDLKMENIVMDEQGYTKLCDFGMATFLSRHEAGLARTICGTPGYMAPEVLCGGGYSYAADWWGLGCLIFEMQMGQGPFVGPDVAATQSNVGLGIECVEMPEDAAWPDLVRRICRREPCERLPVLPDGTQSIEEHPWYCKANFDWFAHGRGDMPALHLPQLARAQDLRNLCSSALARPRFVSYEDLGTGWDSKF